MLRNFNQVVFVLFLIVGALCFASAMASEDSPCYQEAGKSNSAIGKCLNKEYAVANSLLEKKMSTLIASVSQSKIWLTQPKLAADYRSRVISALTRADEQWRSLMETECNDLVGESYTGGSGAPNAVIDCKITMTYKRIKYISEADAYKPYMEY